MNYREYFGSDFEIGIKLNHLPISLVDNSYRNDVCPSFYFQVNNNFFLLWVDYKEVEKREDPESSRYIVTQATNEGDITYPEIYSDTTCNDLFKSDSSTELLSFIYSLVSSTD